MQFTNINLEGVSAIVVAKKQRVSWRQNVTGLLRFESTDQDLFHLMEQKIRLVIFEKADGTIYIVDPNYPRTSKTDFEFIPLYREEFEKRFPHLIEEIDTTSIYIYTSEKVENINRFLALGIPLVYDEAD